MKMSARNTFASRKGRLGRFILLAWRSMDRQLRRLAERPATGHVDESALNNFSCCNLYYDPSLQLI
jgi:hypothetical protein